MFSKIDEQSLVFVAHLELIRIHLWLVRESALSRGRF
jgi:hypothetical protein